ncbi:hypothetical protein TRFO_22656 [Tritrichomonas foetus]|uniref:Tubby C-terminal domain-containing protein n=1 Tax=Tritrichomonas foetus TaxID=1144522 RepID=A0A1J4KHI9_9EUKA|nr:hypothetical protein TRFO_22656 [Tritrichomonas foetus]|eukprot:OHT08797.1 hypothetical protein TRFO_22656 [Tritrichomonas foetus]
MSQPHQTFPIRYHGNTFMVDPNLLRKSSRRFSEAFNSNNLNFAPDGTALLFNSNLSGMNLTFTARNVDNFLKLCQNLPTDVQDSEMKEICIIAKMFQADSIFQTGLSFVQGSIDPSFSVPDFSQTCLSLENSNEHSQNYGEFDLLDNFTQPVNSNSSNFNASNTNFNASNTNFSASNQNLKPRNINSASTNSMGGNIHHVENFDDLEFDDDSESSSDKKESQTKTNTNPINNNDDENDENQNVEIPQNIVIPIVYDIRADKSVMKCNKYVMRRNGKVLLSAKKKSGLIVISRGPDVHLSIKSGHVCRIVQQPLYNEINVEGQKIILKYVRCSNSGAISFRVSFNHEGTQLFWNPKYPKVNPKTGQFSLKLSGAHKHVPVPSRRNAVLINSEGRTTYIVRKMAENFFEAECHPDVDPIIVFALALSSIVGPSIDYSLHS